MKRSIAAVVLAAAMAPVGAQTISNGGFELPTIGGSDYFTNLATSFAGWTLNSGDVDVVRSFGGQGWAANSGFQSLDLSGYTAGSISQNVSGFTAGQQYVLTYFYNGTTVGDAKTALSFVGGTSVLGPIIETVASADNIWRRRDVTFTALQSTVGVTFQSLNFSSTGMAIDDVSVAAVPEPHEWAMMLAGLGIVGWAARRARRNGPGTPALAAA
jgi:hypothetical protein